MGGRGPYLGTRICTYTRTTSSHLVFNSRDKQAGMSLYGQSEYQQLCFFQKPRCIPDTVTLKGQKYPNTLVILYPQ